MSIKTYLQEQIRLVSLSSYDLFTQEESVVYEKIIEMKRRLEELGETEDDKKERQRLIQQKSKLKNDLENLILAHKDSPRRVNLESVLYYPQDADYEFPKGITYKNLKVTKKISEFCCELSRALGLENLDCTLDIVVVKWKNMEILQQLVYNGMIMPILTKEGMEEKHYHFFTASAGQLRRDKIVMISDVAWEKIHKQLECGMDWNLINERKSLNPNKYMAYTALSASATDLWDDFDIDRCIVIPDFEAEVTAEMMYIKPDYTYEIGTQTVMIDHTDGCGMMLPEVSTKNFMVRGNWVKGLLASFDFIRFCDENKVQPVIKDAWGKEHNLVEERINVILTTSMFKLYKLYNSWEEYKMFFKRDGCHFCKTNYEEDEIPNTTLNYQMIQTLSDFTDEEIKTFTSNAHQKIKGVTNNMDSMLKTLKADKNSDNPYKAALAIYPELLREAYTRESLKAIRKRMLLDAKSGRIWCKNKRLFAIPDLYAACEHWFMGIENPEGLLKKDEIACKIFRRHDKADVLRSPHLYCEHAIQAITHDQNVYSWFYTNGVYTSCKSMISRILQFDVDGDQLNVVVDPLFVEIAERNIKKYNVIPLFYEAEKANAEPISNESLFNGLKRAHEFSNIGEISNMLTRLWNKDKPDRVVAALLTYLNNLRIDGAKTGIVHEYKNFPKIARRVGKATGGRNGRMPYFFQYSRNGRRDTKENKEKKYAEKNNSTMNRICYSFDDIKHINMNYAGIPQFNWQMLLKEPCKESNTEIAKLFCEMDKATKARQIETEENMYDSEKQLNINYSEIADDIVHEMEARYGSLEYTYPYVVKYLFAGEGADKAKNKQMFWRVYGNIAVRILKQNIENCDICPECKTRIPAWVEDHKCVKSAKGFCECIDCGVLCERINPKQCRCKECQEVYTAELKKLWHREIRRQEKEAVEKRITQLQSSLNVT